MKLGRLATLVQLRCDVPTLTMRRLCATLVLTIALPCLPAEGAARSGGVLQEFEMAPCLDMITVPVTCSGETYEFLLDTGASGCLVDKSLVRLLGEAVGRVYAQTPTGVEAVELYLPLSARVGDLAIDADEPVACVDLSGFERITGRDIRGIIGMSFMQDFGLQLDFDDGAIRFLRSPVPDTEELGEELELEFEPRSTPRLTATIADTTQWTFVLDTGCGSAGSMDHRTCVRLASQEMLHPVGLTRGAALMRDFTATLAVLDSLSLGPFTHKNLMLSRTESSVLGIPFLAAYNITLDFPQRRVWFSPSARHGAPPGLDLSGLSLISLGGDRVVEGTRPGGPAAAAGFEQGDVVVSVGGTNARDLSLSCIDAIMCDAMGDTVEIVASRSGSEYSRVLDLRWTALADTLDKAE